MATQFDAQFPDAAETEERIAEREAAMQALRQFFAGMAKVMQDFAAKVLLASRSMQAFLAAVRGQGRPMRFRGKPNRRARKAQKMLARAMERTGEHRAVRGDEITAEHPTLK